MYFYLGLEELIPNVFIELLERTSYRTISVSKIQSYATAILTDLNTKGISGISVITRDKTNQFFHDYQDLFSISNVGYDTFITISNKITSQFLRKKFRIKLPLEVLKSFTSNKIIEILLSE